MKFLDNIIAWGDSLFAQNTMEMVNQAEQLYIIADMILGPRPQQVRVPKQYQPYQEDSTSYATIVSSLDAFSNALVDVENLVRVPIISFLPLLERFRPSPPLPRIHWANEQTLFFCIPPNPTLLAYWDTVADVSINPKPAQSSGAAATAGALRTAHQPGRPRSSGGQRQRRNGGRAATARLPLHDVLPACH